MSAFCFSLMGVAIRFASASINLETIVFYRNFTGLLLFAVYGLAVSRNQVFFRTSRLWMHAWRALVGIAAMYGFFYAIGHLNLSSAMVFTYSSPVFIPLLATLFLRERLTFTSIFAALLGLTGVILITRPSHDSLFNLWTLLGLSSSLLAAGAFVTVRALTRTEPPGRIVFYFCLIATLIATGPYLLNPTPLAPRQLALLTVIGVTASLSQILLTRAYQFAPASQIGPMNYFAILFSGLWAFLIWHEIPALHEYAGMLVILVALLMCLPASQNWLNRWTQPQNWFGSFRQK